MKDQVSPFWQRVSEDQHNMITSILRKDSAVPKRKGNHYIKEPKEEPKKMKLPQVDMTEYFEMCKRSEENMKGNV